jgi:CheY-like chemotaxis protein
MDMAYAPAVEIVLIEDSPDDIELTMRALRRAGLSNEIVVARDGQEAIDFIFGEGAYTGRGISDKPKVILLDLKLPKIAGIEVLRRIKNDDRTRAIPIVVLTSSMDLQDVVGCYELGVNSYIVKPVNFERFSAAVQKLGMYWLLIDQPPRHEEVG